LYRLECGATGEAGTQNIPHPHHSSPLSTSQLWLGHQTNHPQGKTFSSVAFPDPDLHGSVYEWLPWIQMQSRTRDADSRSGSSGKTMNICLSLPFSYKLYKLLRFMFSIYLLALPVENQKIREKVNI